METNIFLFFANNKYVNRKLTLFFFGGGLGVYMAKTSLPQGALRYRLPVAPGGWGIGVGSHRFPCEEIIKWSAALIFSLNFSINISNIKIKKVANSNITLAMMNCFFANITLPKGPYKCTTRQEIPSNHVVAIILCCRAMLPTGVL